MVSKIWILALTVLLPATPVYATTYLFTLSATVSGLETSQTVYTEDCCQTSDLPTQSTSVHLGDKLALSFTFNPATATLGNTAIPNNYELSVSDLAVRLGDYQGSLQPPGTTAQITIYNNAGDPASPYDAFDLSISQLLTPGTSPFVLDDRPIQVGLNFFSSDATGKARKTDDINEEPPLSAYSNQAAYLSFFSSDYKKTVGTDVSLSSEVATLSPLSAVPEASTWTMMVFGIGIAGFAMRRRNVTMLVPQA